MQHNSHLNGCWHSQKKKSPETEKMQKIQTENGHYALVLIKYNYFIILSNGCPVTTDCRPQTLFRVRIWHEIKNWTNEHSQLNCRKKQGIRKTKSLFSGSILCSNIQYVEIRLFVNTVNRLFAGPAEERLLHRESHRVYNGRQKLNAESYGSMRFGCYNSLN